MKLINDATSPFGRKILVAALEFDLPFEEVFIDLGDAAWLYPHNPLRQIPTLLADDGSAIYDSDVILMYLDRIVGGRLFPKDRDIACSTTVALANGLMEATLTRLIESRRPAEVQNTGLIDKLEQRIQWVVPALEDKADLLRRTDIAADHVTVGCALGYLDFRHSEAWRSKAPQLSDWYAAIAERPSFLTTVPTRTAPTKSTR